MDIVRSRDVSSMVAYTCPQQTGSPLGNLLNMITCMCILSYHGCYSKGVPTRHGKPHGLSSRVFVELVCQLSVRHCGRPPKRCDGLAMDPKGPVAKKRKKCTTAVVTSVGDASSACDINDIRRGAQIQFVF